MMGVKTIEVLYLLIMGKKGNSKNIHLVPKDVNIIRIIKNSGYCDKNNCSVGKRKLPL